MAEQKHLCYNCFQEREAAEGPCPYCGFDLAENEKKFPVALRAGTVLNGRYIIGRVLGQGGFGITYLALDTQLNAKVAIKEFIPSEISTRVGGTTVSVMMDTKSEEFAYGAERFQEEARTLAKFIGNPNIAAVTSYFDENDTSYFVMDYIEGISFKTYIANHGGKISVEETLNVMIPALRALTAVHAEGFIHRDVTPDNIYITKDGMVKLLDFGSARYSIGDKSKSLDVILKVGYAPKEQYIRRSRQGPFTDVYSCAACFYAALTGFLPPESLERMDNDTLVPVSQCGIEIPEYLDKAILKGLAVQPEDRFQSAAEFLDAIESQRVVEVPVSGGAAPAPEKKKAKPALIAGIAAAVIVVLGIGIVIGGGGQMTVDEDGEEVQLVEAEVPSITIRGQIYSTDITELSLDELVLTDAEFEQLKYMVNLRELDLPASSEITNLAPLTNLNQLQVLRMNDGDSICSVTDLTPLASLTNLENLQLTCMAENLSPLSGLTNLKVLSLRLPVTVDDISFLSNLTSLQSLNIQDNSSGNAHIILDDLTPLSGLTKLQELRLGVDGIADFDWAQNLTELRELTFWGNEATYTDLDGLKKLTKLQSLTLPYPAIVGNEELDPEPYDIQGLAGLTELTHLQMYAGVKDLSPLANLTKLQTLYIYNGTTKPSDTSLEPMRNLTELREFYFYAYGENVSVDLSPLAGLAKLNILSITAQSYYDSPNPSVTNLSALENLQDLRTLELVCTNVSNFSPLRSLENLQSVTIINNGEDVFLD